MAVLVLFRCSGLKLCRPGFHINAPTVVLSIFQCPYATPNLRYLFCLALAGEKREAQLFHLALGGRQLGLKLGKLRIELTLSLGRLLLRGIALDARCGVGDQVDM